VIEEMAIQIIRDNNGKDREIDNSSREMLLTPLERYYESMCVAG